MDPNVADNNYNSDEDDYDIYPIPPPVLEGYHDLWTWDRLNCSTQALIYEPEDTTVVFHPEESYGTAAVRGTIQLNNKCHYWEIQFETDGRVRSTTTMIGVCTARANLQSNEIHNLIGFDNNGWGLDHYGFIWHNNVRRQYMDPMEFNEISPNIGVLFDGVAGTISFYKNGFFMGTAFNGLNDIQEELFPVVASSSIGTEITVTTRKTNIVNLMDRSCASIVKRIMNAAEESGTDLEGEDFRNGSTSGLPIPNRLKNYVNVKLVQTASAHFFPQS